MTMNEKSTMIGLKSLSPLFLDTDQCFCLQMFFKIDVLKNFAIFTGKSPILITLQAQWLLVRVPMQLLNRKMYFSQDIGFNLKIANIETSPFSET